MAIFLRHTGCPRCGSSDALAIYSDGGTFCFSCGIPSGATSPDFSRDLQQTEDEDSVLLPTDLSHDFPQEVVDWIAPTGVKIEELISHGYFFSNSAGGLVRILQPKCSTELYERVRRGYGTYETRSFNRGISPRGPKSKFYGSKENIYAYSYRGQAYNPLQQETFFAGFQTYSRQGEEANRAISDNTRRRKLVIVEDSISSIKTGRCVPSAPLFGSSIGKDKLTRLVKPFDEIIVWLDSNKLNAARKIAEQAQLLGKKSRVIFTELDPKYVDNVEELVEGL